MATREAIIQSEDVGAAEGAEALIKKHEDFTKTLAVQDVKINALKDNADRLIDNEHYDSPAIAERIAAVLARYWTIPVQRDAALLVVTCFVRLHALLRVVGSCSTKFETGQTFEPKTPNIFFVP